jgi:undecaprenyl diphosphate synthase
METIRSITRHLGEKGVPYVTLFAFSTENWKRPTDEVRGLFRLMAQSIKKEARALHENNVRIRHLGRVEGLDAKIVNDITEAAELTKANTGLNLSVALNYGGRQELTDALQRLVLAGVKAIDVNETLISTYLYTAELPDVDLLVRTAGEMRISNFLLWQSAYAEYYATPTLWPDFNNTEADKALADFAQRKRRFGGL